MRVIVERVPAKGTNDPMIKLIIHGAPHRRMHHNVIQKYREELRRAFHASEILTPICETHDFRIVFINPCSPDKDNLFVALCQAMDGNTLKGPGILRDDSLVGVIHHMSTMYV
jgi:hypothetical protein